MTETVLFERAEAAQLFVHEETRPLRTVSLARGRDALVAANTELGLALSDDEIDYLVKNFAALKRDPDRRRAHDVRAGELRALPPQDLQRGLDHRRREAAEVAVRDDPQHAREESAGRALGVSRQRAVIEGPLGKRYFPNPENDIYGAIDEPIDILMKVETHNHPTAISPFPGAATGSGGEIRDEGATGRGAKPKAGLTGFSVSHLRIPGFEQPWEKAPLRRVGQTRPHRLRARHHDRRPDRRRRVQQRIRPAQHLRLLPHASNRRRTAIRPAACAAITSPS